MSDSDDSPTHQRSSIWTNIQMEIIHNKSNSTRIVWKLKPMLKMASFELAFSVWKVINKHFVRHIYFFQCTAFLNPKSNNCLLLLSSRLFPETFYLMTKVAKSLCFIRSLKQESASFLLAGLNSVLSYFSQNHLHCRRWAGPSQGSSTPWGSSLMPWIKP
jgi:hypothetical protein